MITYINLEISLFQFFDLLYNHILNFDKFSSQVIYILWASEWVVIILVLFTLCDQIQKKKHIWDQGCCKTERLETT